MQGDTFPGDNQARPLAAVKVGTGSPLWKEQKFGAGEVEMPKDQETGTVKGEVDRDTYAVPGTPFYRG
jgi:hypothetical protein